ncbi:hypothetical protein SAMN05428981_10799 [Bacillus sp. OV194]|nr:hypothetical protein SAMN05428981_10799 [Bacillus sp. OV194]
MWLEEYLDEYVYFREEMDLVEDYIIRVEFQIE